MELEIPGDVRRYPERYDVRTSGDIAEEIDLDDEFDLDDDEEGGDSSKMDIQHKSVPAGVFGETLAATVCVHVYIFVGVHV